MICQECNQEKPAHEHYDRDGNLTTSKLVATNSGRSWKKDLCYECSRAFQDRTFCVIRREGDIVYMIAAF